jgi:hypothetical protein
MWSERREKEINASAQRSDYFHTASFVKTPSISFGRLITFHTPVQLWPQFCRWSVPNPIALTSTELSWMGSRVVSRVGTYQIQGPLELCHTLHRTLPRSAIVPIGNSRFWNCTSSIMQLLLIPPEHLFWLRDCRMRSLHKNFAPRACSIFFERQEVAAPGTSDAARGYLYWIAQSYL